MGPLGPIGYSPLAVGAIADIAINDVSGVLDTSIRTVNLAGLVTGGRSSKTYTATTTSKRLSVAVADGVLSVSFIDDVNFPYSDHAVKVTVSDGTDMASKSFNVRRNRKPRAGANFAELATEVAVYVGTNHPDNTGEYKPNATGDVRFADDDMSSLTYSGVATESAKEPHVMFIAAKTGVKVVGLKSTWTGTANRVRGNIAVDVTATDSGKLFLASVGAFRVEVNEAPKLSTTPVLRDVAIKLSETPTGTAGDDATAARTQAIDGHFTDPEGQTLTYKAMSSDMSVATVTVSNEADGTVTVNPIGAGKATIVVTATEPLDSTDGRTGLGQTAAGTFEVTVLAE